MNFNMGYLGHLPVFIKGLLEVSKPWNISIIMDSKVSIVHSPGELLIDESG